MIVPEPFADRIQHNPLEAMVVPDRPVTFFAKRKLGHDRSRQLNIARNRIVGGHFWEIEIMLHLIIPLTSCFRPFQQVRCSAHLMLRPQSAGENEIYACQWQPSGLPPKRLSAGPQRFLDLPQSRGTSGIMKHPVLDPATLGEIIEMALSDHDSFNAIQNLHGLGPDAVKTLMRQNLKSGSYRAWRKRVRAFSDRREVYK